MNLEQTWRWFGPDDQVSLEDIRQTGATGIVTALHQLPPGEIWSQGEIIKRKKLIEAQKLTWSVVESVPVHESIKTRSGDYRRCLDNYKQTLRNLGACDIKLVCYNFMPLLDWTRTDLNFTLADGSQVLRFDIIAFIAFDVFILNRAGAEKQYQSTQLEAARHYYDQLTDASRATLQSSILMGLPGTVENFSLEGFKRALKSYENIDESTFRSHYYSFLEEIIPTAEQAGVRMAVHPDDPPLPIFGLPRIVSNQGDLEQLLCVVDSPYNGLTFCTGSLGANANNQVSSMVERFARKINFAHLRNVTKEKNGSFYESGHLEGDVDMYQVVRTLLLEQHERTIRDKAESAIPIRPDHGPRLLDDLCKETYPGYSAIGRLKGTAALRGLELGISKSLFLY